MKKNLLVAIATCLCVGFLSAQEIQWSELMKSKGSITRILPIKGSTFYATRWVGGLIGFQQLEHHEDFIINAQEKIQKKVGSSLATFEKVLNVNGEIVVFLSDKQEGQFRLFMQRYNEYCTPLSEATLLAEYTVPKHWVNRGEFNIIQSENRQFFCFEYSTPAAREGYERIGFKVISSMTFETISEGEYESEFEARVCDITNHYISNTGDYFIGLKVYKSDEKIFLKSYKNLEKYLIIHITEAGIEEVNLDLKDKRILDMTFSSDNNRFMTFNGLYGDKKLLTGIKGVFYFQLDFQKKQILNEGYSEFTVDFLTQDWSDSEKEKVEKKKAKGKGDPELYGYEIRKNFVMADGSLIGTMEYFYESQDVTYNSVTKMYTTTYWYHYNDLICYKITPEGQFDWIKKIPKTQITLNDQGYPSSFAFYVNDSNKMVIVFNDNLKNYDDDGNYKIPNGDYVHATNYLKKTNCVARVELDLESGNFTRKTFFSRKETEAIAIPKLFNVDYNTNEMLMLLRIGKKEKFGLVKF